MNVFQWTVERQLKRMSYKSTLPYATPMLTQEQKLFHNILRRWSRNPSTEVKRIEDTSIGRHQYQEPHWFKTIMDGSKIISFLMQEDH